MPGAWERHLDPRGDHLRFYTRRSLEELLADFRFEQIEVGSLGPPAGPAGAAGGGGPVALLSGRLARYPPLLRISSTSRL